MPAPKIQSENAVLRAPDARAAPEKQTD